MSKSGISLTLKQVMVSYAYKETVKVSLLEKEDQKQSHITSENAGITYQTSDIRRNRRNKCEVGAVRDRILRNVRKNSPSNYQNSEKWKLAILNY